MESRQSFNRSPALRLRRWQLAALSLLVLAPGLQPVQAEQFLASSRESGIQYNDGNTTAPAARAPGDKRLRVGLALGGGGTRGSAHVGVIRELLKAGIPIDCIAGTSMGAIVGGMYCAGLSVDRIEEIILSKSFLHSFFTVPVTLRLSLIPILSIPELFSRHHVAGLYRGNRFANFIDRNLPPEHRQIEKLPVAFCAVATDLLDGKPKSIVKGDLGRAIQCSSAIPMLRRPVEFQNGLYVDGGATCNLPVDECRSLGADFVIAVNVNESIEPMQVKAFWHMSAVATRCLNLYLSDQDEPCAARADIVIHPDVNGISLLSTNLKLAAESLARGETAGRSAIPEIRDKLDKARAKLD